MKNVNTIVESLDYQRTSLITSLYSIPLSCLNKLNSILVNIKNNPNVEKFKRIKKNNNMFVAFIKPYNNAIDFLKLLGFVEDNEKIFINEINKEFDVGIEVINGKINELNHVLNDYEKIQKDIKQFLSNNDFVEAIEQFKLVIKNIENYNSWKISINESFMYLGIGNIYMNKMNDFAKALEYIDMSINKCIAKGGKRYKLFQQKANCYYKMKDYKQSEKFFQIAVSHKEDEYFSHFGIALNHLKLEEYQKGINVINYLLDKMVDKADFKMIIKSYFVRGECYEKLKNMKERDIDYEYVINKIIIPITSDVLTNKESEEEEQIDNIFEKQNKIQQSFRSFFELKVSNIYLFFSKQ